MIHRKFSLAAIALVAFILVVLTVGLALAQAPAGQEYIVQPGDRLTTIATQFLGDPGAYPQIIDATNVKAAEDTSFVTIDDPNLLSVGQKLWIPVPGFVGTYTAMLPAASSPLRAMTLTLSADAAAQLSADYLNGEAPIVETGAWQDNGDGTATVTLTGRADGTVYEAPIVETGVWTATTSSAVEVTLSGAESPLSLVMSDGLLVTAPDEDAHGSVGLKLYHFEVIARNSLQATLTGTVTYQQRVALPPQALITVQLVDVSVADAPAEIVAQQVITAGGRQAPFNFELTYYLLKIQENHTYAVQARIEMDGQLTFISTTRYPVLTQGAPTTVEVVVDPAESVAASVAQACAAVPVTTSPEAPPDHSSYLAYTPDGAVTSDILSATLTVDPQAADAAQAWRDAALTGLGYCAGDYAPENVTVYAIAPDETTVVVFARVIGDDSVAGQEVRLDLARQADSQWQVTWAGVRFLCARGANTTDLTAELCP